MLCWQLSVGLIAIEVEDDEDGNNEELSKGEELEGEDWTGNGELSFADVAEVLCLMEAGREPVLRGMDAAPTVFAVNVPTSYLISMEMDVIAARLFDWLGKDDDCDAGSVDDETDDEGSSEDGEGDGSSSPLASSSLPSSTFEILPGAGNRSGVNQAATSPSGITISPVESTTTGVWTPRMFKITGSRSPSAIDGSWSCISDGTCCLTKLIDSEGSWGFLTSPVADLSVGVGGGSIETAVGVTVVENVDEAEETKAGLLVGGAEFPEDEADTSVACAVGGGPEDKLEKELSPRKVSARGAGTDAGEEDCANDGRTLSLSPRLLDGVEDHQVTTGPVDWVPEAEAGSEYGIERRELERRSSFEDMEVAAWAGTVCRSNALHTVTYIQLIGGEAFAGVRSEAAATQMSEC